MRTCFVHSVQEKKAQKHTELVKQLYDYAKTEDANRSSQVPDELVVEHMDEEQIWQQLELQNAHLWSSCLKLSGKLLSGKDEAFRLNYKVVGEEEVEDEDEDEDEDIEEDDEDDSELGSLDEDDESEDDDDESPTKRLANGKRTASSRPGRKSVLDDKFFNMSEMEEYLEAEDRKEMQKGSQKRDRNDDIDDGIDYFKESEDEGDDDDEDDIYNYADFFDADAAANRGDDDEDEVDERTRIRKMMERKNKTKLKEKREDLGLDQSDSDEEEDDVEDDNDEADDDDDDDDKKSGKVKFDLSKNTYRSDSDRSDDEDDDESAGDAKKRPDDDDDTAERSTHEHRQERLRLRIQDMEEQAMGEKSWQLRGEINSENRPQNSLLEEVLEFDSTIRPAPVITEETTQRLEDIIRQRIKDKAWNDVERKFKPVNTPQEFRKKLVLDQEKSKESLAQIYEKEYMKEVDKLKPDGGDDDKEPDEPKEHVEIRTLMKDLFAKLDALGNFYYTPKVAQADVRIITNIPAINMEEVAPVAVSDAALLAPEEVRPRDKGDAVGKSERTQTDKNRERRQKKQKQRVLAKAKERKEAEKAANGVVSSTSAEKKKLLAKVSKGRNILKVCLVF